MNSSESQGVGDERKIQIGAEVGTQWPIKASPGLMPRELVANQQLKLGEIDFTDSQRVFDNDITGNAIKSTLKIIAGVGIATVGGLGAALVLPLTLLGAGIGAALGKHRSQKFHDFSHKEEMTTAGAMIGSLGFLCAASYGKKMMESGYGDLTHLHETEEGRKVRKEYKKTTKHLKSAIVNKKKTIAYLNKIGSKDINNRKIRSKDINNRVDELNSFVNQLEVIREPNKKIKAIELIFKDCMRNNNLNTEEKGNVRTHIEKELSNLNAQNPAQKIDLGEGRGRYIVSKNPPNSSKMFEIGKISNKLGAGQFGDVFAIEYLQRAKEKEKAGSMIVKLAKEDFRAEQDVINESAKLIYLNQEKNLDNPRVQEAPVAIFKGGYVGKEYSGGSLKQVIFGDKIKLTTADKTKFTNDVFKQVHFLHDKKIYHGDIKPGNMLCEKNWREEITKVAISDYGGARTFDELFKTFPDNVNRLLGVHTAYYTSYAIAFNINIIISKTKNESSNPQVGEIKKKAQTQIEILLKKNEEYATALSLFQLWTGSQVTITATYKQAGSLTQSELSQCEAKLQEAKAPPEIRKMLIEKLSYGLHDEDKRLWEYKQTTKQIKSEIQSKENSLGYFTKEEFKLKMEEDLKLLKDKLKEAKKLNPEKLKAIDLIVEDWRNKLDKNLNEKERAEAENKTREQLTEGFTKLNKNNRAAEINLGQEDHHYFISKSPPKSPKMIEIGKIGKRLGQGSFGDVYAFTYLRCINESDKAIPMVLKFAKDNDSVAKNDIMNESRILNQLNQSGNVIKNPAVQKAPVATFDGGYISPLYSAGSLEKVIENKTKMEVSEKVDFTNDVLTQLKYVHVVGIYHGDIKPGNILCEEDENGKITKLAIGDYGGAKTFDELFKKFPKKWDQIFITLSPFYTSQTIILEIKSIIEEANSAKGSTNIKSKQINARRKIEELLKKNDEYATALTLYKLWTLESVNVQGMMAGFIPDKELALCEKNLRNAGMPEAMIKMMMTKLAYGLN